MTHQDIINMAVEVGATGCANPDKWGFFEISYTSLERFARLVASHEREKVANWMVERSYATGHGDTIEDLLTEIDWQAGEREREACRLIVLDNSDAEGICCTDDVLEAFRQRGEK